MLRLEATQHVVKGTVFKHQHDDMFQRIKSWRHLREPAFLLLKNLVHYATEFRLTTFDFSRHHRSDGKRFAVSTFEEFAVDSRRIKMCPLRLRCSSQVGLSQIRRCGGWTANRDAVSAGPDPGDRLLPYTYFRKWWRDEEKGSRGG
jgi:hypothetical protein